MPTVRPYTRQINPQGLPGARKSQQRIAQVEAPVLRVQPTPEAFGAQLGETVAKVGEAFFGEQQRQAAENRQAQARAVALAQKQQNEERVSVAERDFLSQLNIYKDDPQIGVFNSPNRQGNDARGLPNEATKFSNDLYDKISSGLANDQQRLDFAQKARRHQENFDVDVMKYTSGQITKAEAENSTALVGLETRGAVTSAHDPIRVAQSVAAVDKELDRYGASHGELQPVTDNKKAKAHSDLWEGVIRRLMVDSQDPQNPLREMSLPFAKAYFQAHGDEIEANKRNELKTKLDVTANESSAAQYANAAFRDNGPKSDAAPLEMDKILEPLRKKFATSDPELYKAIKTQVEDMGKTFTESVKARSDYRDGTVQKAIIDGVTLDQLVAMPEFQMLPPDKQADRKHQILERNHTFEQRARTTEEYWRNRNRQARTEARTEAREARTEAREVKRDEKEVADEKAFALYHDMGRDANALVKMSEPEIYALGEKLGKANMEALLRERKDLIESKPTLDLNMLDRKANEHGFFPYAQKKTPQQKADLGALEKHVRDQFDREPVKPGEKIGRDRQEQIIDESLIEIVTAPGWFGSSVGARKKAAGLIDLKDISAAEQLRLKSRMALEKTRRGLSPFVSDQEIIDLYIAEKEEAQTKAQGAR